MLEDKSLTFLPHYPIALTSTPYFQFNTLWWTDPQRLFDLLTNNKIVISELEGDMRWWTDK